MFSKVILCGRLVNDLVLKTNAQNQKYCFFTVALNNVFSQITNFVPCVAWNRTAENMQRFLKKGTTILVEGKLRSRSLTTDQNIKINSLTISADNVVFLGDKRLTNNPESVHVPEPVTNVDKPPKPLKVDATATPNAPSEPKPTTDHSESKSPTNEGEGINWEE